MVKARSLCVAALALLPAVASCDGHPVRPDATPRFAETPGTLGTDHYLVLTGSWSGLRIVDLGHAAAQGRATVIGHITANPNEQSLNLLAGDNAAFPSPSPVHTFPLDGVSGVHAVLLTSGRYVALDGGDGFEGTVILWVEDLSEL